MRTATLDESIRALLAKHEREKMLRARARHSDPQRGVAGVNAWYQQDAMPQAWSLQLTLAFVFAATSLVLFLLMLRRRRLRSQSHLRAALRSPGALPQAVHRHSSPQQARMRSTTPLRPRYRPQSPDRSLRQNHALASPQSETMRSTSFFSLPFTTSSTSLHLRHGMSAPDVVLQRDRIVALYEEDVQKAPTVELCPHDVLGADGATNVRILQWNINGLLGTGGSITSVDAQAMADAILATNSDVLLLQETANVANDWLSRCGRADAPQQMMVLDSLLRDAGYNILRTPLETPNDNPALVAAKWPLSFTKGCSGVLDSAYRSAVLDADGELRTASYVELSLGPVADAPVLGLFACHLHHHNHHCGDPATGVRASEVETLLSMWRSRPAHMQHIRRLGTLLATDFNEQRRSEYSTKEWAFLTKHAARGADGVHGASGLLERHGFVNVSDVPGVRHGALSKPNGAARFTHWTGTAVDHAYLHTEAGSIDARLSVQSVTTLPVLLSDHLPTVIDLRAEL